MDLVESAGKYTNTSLFLVRGLDLSVTELKKIGFINAFLDDMAHEPHYKNAIYLLFKPEDMSDFTFWQNNQLSCLARTTILLYVVQRS